MKTNRLLCAGAALMISFASFGCGAKESVPEKTAEEQKKELLDQHKQEFPNMPAKKARP